MSSLDREAGTTAAAQARGVAIAEASAGSQASPAQEAGSSAPASGQGGSPPQPSDAGATKPPRATATGRFGRGDTPGSARHGPRPAVAGRRERPQPALRAQNLVAPQLASGTGDDRRGSPSPGAWGYRRSSSALSPRKASLGELSSLLKLLPRPTGSSLTDPPRHLVQQTEQAVLRIAATVDQNSASHRVLVAGGGMPSLWRVVLARASDPVIDLVDSSDAENAAAGPGAEGETLATAAASPYSSSCVTAAMSALAALVPVSVAYGRGLSLWPHAPVADVALAVMGKLLALDSVDASQHQAAARLLLACSNGDDSFARAALSANGVSWLLACTVHDIFFETLSGASAAASCLLVLADLCLRAPSNVAIALAGLASDAQLPAQPDRASDAADKADVLSPPTEPPPAPPAGMLVDAPSATLHPPSFAPPAHPASPSSAPAPVLDPARFTFLNLVGSVLQLLPALASKPGSGRTGTPDHVLSPVTPGAGALTRSRWRGRLAWAAKTALRSLSHFAQASREVPATVASDCIELVDVVCEVAAPLAEAGNSERMSAGVPYLAAVQAARVLWALCRASSEDQDGGAEASTPDPFDAAAASAVKPAAAAASRPQSAILQRFRECGARRWVLCLFRSTLARWRGRVEAEDKLRFDVASAVLALTCLVEGCGQEASAALAEGAASLLGWAARLGRDIAAKVDLCVSRMGEVVGADEQAKLDAVREVLEQPTPPAAVKLDVWRRGGDLGEPMGGMAGARSQSASRQHRAGHFGGFGEAGSSSTAWAEHDTDPEPLDLSQGAHHMGWSPPLDGVAGIGGSASFRSASVQWSLGDDASRCLPEPEGDRTPVGEASDPQHAASSSVSGQHQPAAGQRNRFVLPKRKDPPSPAPAESGSPPADQGTALVPPAASDDPSLTEARSEGGEQSWCGPSRACCALPWW